MGLGFYGWPYYSGYGYYPYGYGSYYRPAYGYGNGYGYGSIAGNVQAALTELGYYGGPIDGVLGPRSRRAIAAFQARNGIPPTARIDRRLLAALRIG